MNKDEQILSLNELFEKFPETRKMSENFVKKVGEAFADAMSENPTIAILMASGLSSSLILSLLPQDPLSLLPKMIPNLPDYLIERAKPFEKLRNVWGKISSEKFFTYYSSLYEWQQASADNSEKKEKMKKIYELFEEDNGNV